MDNKRAVKVISVKKVRITCVCRKELDKSYREMKKRKLRGKMTRGSDGLNSM